MEELQLLKILAVQYLRNELTCDYINIMTMIAHFCEEVMGKAPCQFAVVGMVSLARKEITPYSDFEHIIVLENFEESYAKTEAILNYFKWLILELIKPVCRMVKYLQSNVSPKN